MCSAALFFEVTLFTGPLIDAMLGRNSAALASSFAKTLALALAATLLLIVSAFWV